MPLRPLAVAVVVAGLATAALAVPAGPRPARPLQLQGIAEDPFAVGTFRVVAAGDVNARYQPGTSVLAPGTADSPSGLAARAFLAAGTVPGTSDLERELATRALLDLRLLVRPGGGIVAAMHPGWDYVWPRDTAFAVAALSATGHRDMAYDAVRFLARTQLPDGTWPARSYPTGEPVEDGRRPQLDAVGLVLWAVGEWREAGGSETDLDGLWPVVTRAAEAAVGSVRADGLPRASSDYWETAPGRTLETAAALAMGLRSAAELARGSGRQGDADRWGAAGGRLERAITSTFGAHGYQRLPDGSGGADAAVTLLGPPFASAPAAQDVAAAVLDAESRLTLPNGGIIPGSEWAGDPLAAWTPETGLFALSAAASGDAARATKWLQWLADHRTALGAIPEQVDRRGRPASVAPLAWTDALVLLALTAGPAQ